MILVPIESARGFPISPSCDYSPRSVFWDTATYWLQIAYFSRPTLIRCPRSLCSLWNFALKLTMRKLESWGYSPVKTAWSYLALFWQND